MCAIAAAHAGAQENYATWSDSAVFVLNTSVSGANEMNTVTKFPVLVRLTPANFNGFPNAKLGGADIRFANSNGQHLHYQIERWEDIAAYQDTAEIWVLVDT